MNKQSLKRTNKFILQLLDQLEKEELTIEEASKPAKLISEILYLVFEKKDDEKTNQLLADYMELFKNE